MAKTATFIIRLLSILLSNFLLVVRHTISGLVKFGL